MKKIKKSNAGRKPVSDKKVQVSLYVLSSQIEKFGGLEKFKEALHEFVVMRVENIAPIKNKNHGKIRKISKRNRS